MLCIPCPRVQVNEYTYSRFMQKVRYIDGCDCWLWIGARSKNGEGYGFFAYKGKNRMAHRLMYIWWIGPIPTGMQLDHLCREMGCVNPSHLEPVTLHENNVVRGTGLAAQNYRKTQCPKGHEYDGVNSNGARICKKCQYEATLRSRRNHGTPQRNFKKRPLTEF